MATLGVQGWHPGEVSVQRQLGFADAVSNYWQVIENSMREQHRIFHTSNLLFIPVTTTDADGRPWASIVAGSNGQIGFVKGPDLNTLVVNARLWDGDPLLNTIRAWIDTKGRDAKVPERFLIAGLGIEFPTRRRNKFAGFIRDVRPQGELDYKLDLHVNQSLGNCPKYINVRQLVPHPDTNPSILYQRQYMSPPERLPDKVIDFITSADTVFLGSVYKSDASSADTYPSHAGMNSRGGLPGFMRVSPSDGRSVVIPDYSGNRFMSSLGNIEASRQVALTIVSFTTGDVLYLTGTAKILIGPPALAIMARQACITVMNTTGFVFVQDAFPIRQKQGTEVESSPYSPKIKYLVEEPQSQSTSTGGHKARLVSATQLSNDLAVFKFEVVPRPGIQNLKIRPGQAIALDFMDWIGPPEYHHMANSAPGSINDDRVRTWTVSSSHECNDVTWFELTVREMKGGAVTGALFDVLRQHPSRRWVSPITIKRNVVADIVGVTGDFFLGNDDVNTLWVAGGIGITPFLAMFSALSERGDQARGDVVLALAAREPEIMLKLMQVSLRKTPLHVKVRIDLFTHQDDVHVEGLDDMNIQIVTYKGRISPEYWKEVAGNRDVLICGPGGFGDAAVEGLRSAGVPNEKILREGFY